MTPELEIARAAAEAGGNIVSRYFRKEISIHGKDDSGYTYNVATNADVETEQVILESIRKARPSDIILGEESMTGDAAAEHLWVVDPIDGTNNFIHGIPHFAISIAYYRRGIAECGVVYNPITGDWYVAARGRGAFWNDQQVRVTAHDKLDLALVGVGFYYDRGAVMEATLFAIRDLFHQNIHGIRRFGAASLDLCYIGCGMLSAFFEFQLSFWDFAAGSLFVEEAGGRVTTCHGGPVPAGKTSMLATNGHLHTRVLEIVRVHAPR